MPFQKFFEYFSKFFRIFKKKLHHQKATLSAIFLAKNHSICFDIKSSISRITKVGNFNKMQKSNESKINIKTLITDK